REPHPEGSGVAAGIHRQEALRRDRRSQEDGRPRLRRKLTAAAARPGHRMAAGIGCRVGSQPGFSLDSSRWMKLLPTVLSLAAGSADVIGFSVWAACSPHTSPAIWSFSPPTSSAAAALR